MTDSEWTYTLEMSSQPLPSGQPAHQTPHIQTGIPFAPHPLPRPSSTQHPSYHGHQSNSHTVSRDDGRGDQYGQPYWQSRLPPQRPGSSSSYETQPYASNGEGTSEMAKRGRDGYWRAVQASGKGPTPESIAQSRYTAGPTSPLTNFEPRQHVQQSEHVRNSPYQSPNEPYRSPRPAYEDNGGGRAPPMSVRSPLPPQQQPPSAPPVGNTGGPTSSSGISLVFKRPAQMQGEEVKERVDDLRASPGAGSNSGSAKKRRKILEWVHTTIRWSSWPI